MINTDGRKARNRLENVKKLRSLFNYDPHDDVFVPCRLVHYYFSSQSLSNTFSELALSFSRGDVLHILDTSDSNWWQATLDGSNCRDQLAGIIPSPSFRQQFVILVVIAAVCCLFNRGAVIGMSFIVEFFSINKKTKVDQNRGKKRKRLFPI